MKYKFLSILTLFSLVFNSCASEPYLKENSAFIVFKTATHNYADMGFVYLNNSEVKLEFYSSGQALISLRVTNDSVCMSTLACVSKDNFNKDVLVKAYPKDILDNIFRGKPIFNSENIKKVSNGFTQNIKSSSYSIEYSVLNTQIVFIDKTNGIVIKIKDNI